MNEVFLDTETTGLSFRDGHKIVEIACIETKDLIATGKVFHKLINPKRSMPEEAVNSTASGLENSRIVLLDVLGCLPQPDLLSIWSLSQSELMARSNMS